MRCISLLVMTTSYIFLSGCTSAFYLSPVTQRDERHDMFYVEGLEVAVSIGDSSTVSLCAKKIERNEIVLHLYVRNLFTTRCDYFPDSIEVTYVQPGERVTVWGANGQPKVDLETEYYSTKMQWLHVYSPNEYVGKLRDEQSMQLFFQAFSGSMNAYNAGKSTSRTSGSIGNPLDLNNIPFKATTKGYDYGSKAAIDIENRRDLEAKRNQFEYSNEIINAGLLKRTTLLPGQAVEGDVFVEFMQSPKYYVKVRIGGEVHLFKLIPQAMQ